VARLYADLRKDRVYGEKRREERGGRREREGSQLLKDSCVVEELLEIVVVSSFSQGSGYIGRSIFCVIEFMLWWIDVAYLHLAQAPSLTSEPPSVCDDDCGQDSCVC